MRKFLFTIFLVLPGCASLSAAGEKVKLTTEVKDTQGCKLLGKVQATPPYSLPSDWKKKLRNAAGDLGANVVYTEGAGWKSTVDGSAYTCP